MWKKSIDFRFRPLLSADHLLNSQVRCINNAEIAPRYQRMPKIGWFRRRGTRQLYPDSNPKFMRQVGVDLNLQERLDQMFVEEKAEELKKRVDIGFPVNKSELKNCDNFGIFNQKNLLYFDR